MSTTIFVFLREGKNNSVTLPPATIFFCRVGWFLGVLLCLCNLIERCQSLENFLCWTYTHKNLYAYKKKTGLHKSFFFSFYHWSEIWINKSECVWICTWWCHIILVAVCVRTNDFVYTGTKPKIMGDYSQCRVCVYLCHKFIIYDTNFIYTYGQACGIRKNDKQKIDECHKHIQDWKKISTYPLTKPSLSTP